MQKHEFTASFQPDSADWLNAKRTVAWCKTSLINITAYTLYYKDTNTLYILNGTHVILKDKYWFVLIIAAIVAA